MKKPSYQLTPQGLDKFLYALAKKGSKYFKGSQKDADSINFSALEKDVRTIGIRSRETCERIFVNGKKEDGQPIGVNENSLELMAKWLDVKLNIPNDYSCVEVFTGNLGESELLLSSISEVRTIQSENKDKNLTSAKQNRDRETYVLTQKGLEKIDDALESLNKSRDNTVHDWLTFHAVRKEIRLSGDTIKKILEKSVAVENTSLQALFNLLFKLLEEQKKEVQGIELNGGQCGIDWTLKKNPEAHKNVFTNDKSQTSFEEEVSQCIHNLPSRSYSKFFGRENEINKLLRCLSPEDNFALTVIDGIGGVGKTSLVLEAVYRSICQSKSTQKNDCKSLPKFDVIIFTSAKETELLNNITNRLESSRTLTSIIKKIAYVLKDTSILHGNYTEKINKIRAHFSKKRTLLIIDNFETVKDSSRVLSFLRELHSEIKVIITTREQIALDAPISLRNLPKSDGLKFIRHVASEKGLNLSKDEHSALYDATGGVPLAIVFALGRRSQMPKLSSVIADISNPDGEISHFCFRKSVDDLKQSLAYRLLMATAIFHSPPLPDAIYEVAGCSDLLTNIADREMRKLVLRSLVNLGKHGLQGRYELLSLTREYVLNELKTNKDFKREALDRWVKWYLDLAKECTKGERHEYQMHYDTIEEEWDNFLAVLRYCKDEKRYADIRDLWFYLNNYANIRGKWEDRLFWLELIIEESRLREEMGTAVKAMTRRARTLLLMASDNQLKEAEKILLKAWRLRDCDGVSFSCRDYILNHLAGLYIRLSDYEEAHRWLDIEQDQLNKAENLEPKDRISHQIYIDRERTDVLFHEKKFSKAKELGEKIIEHSKQVDKLRSRNYVRRLLAEIAIDERKFSDAEKLLVLGFTGADSLKDKRRMAYYYGSFAILERAREDFPKARDYAKMAEKEFHQLGMVRNCNRIKSFLSKLSNEEENSDSTNSSGIDRD